ncbi:hypothetical protein DYB37_000430 [Aphanomyces astaci]|uniref:EF-hand domain-containing protein n=1 Tax=Aphanomyces astaci TaxID=112090 RepID=A0A3R7A5B0_APHAT|nr:hypothetical protein DYB35_000381 [Aphanomyces astaci]RHZ22526.1 hypothetical protein DYB37_000430 [Aphanomyces astaci]
MVLPKVDECRGGAAVVKRGRTLSKPLDAAGVIDANVAALRGLELSKLPFMEEMVPYRARRHPETLSTLARCTAYTIRKKALELQAQAPLAHDHTFFSNESQSNSLQHDSLFVDRVFSILDEDKSGIIEWPEFIRAMSALEKGDLRDRIRFLFQVQVTRQFVDEILFKLHPTGGGVVTSQDVINYIDQAPQDDIFTLFGRTMLTETDRRRAQEEHMTGATLDMDNNEDDDPA